MKTPSFAKVQFDGMQNN